MVGISWSFGTYPIQVGSFDWLNGFFNKSITAVLHHIHADRFLLEKKTK